MEWANLEANRERDLKGDKNNIAKYESIAGLMKNAAGRKITDKGVNKQARRVLELLRQRLRLQRESVLSDVRLNAEKRFAKAMGNPTRRVRITPPSKPLDSNGRVIRGHDVKLPDRISVKELNELITWISNTRGEKA